MSRLNFIAPLFVPGNRPERFAKAAASGADAIIVDLEDAVAADAKETARNALEAGFTSLPVIVRVNAIGTRWHAEDVEAALRLPIAAIMLPKAEDGEAFAALASRAQNDGRPLVALVETARGIADARAVAAHPGVGRLAFGSVDYCADLGCAHTRAALGSARSELVLASRLHGRIAPLDGVTTAIDTPADAEDDARHAQELGFGGKLCIHPRQIEAVLSGFRPTPEQLAWAEKVLASGDGAAAVDGAMVDEPVRIRARSILARLGR